MMNKIVKIFSSMPKREKVIVVILLTVFLFSIGKFTSSNVKFAIHQEAGVFAEGMLGRIKDLNPLFVEFNDADRDVSTLIFSGLIKYDPAKRNFFPDLASSWEKNNNGSVYTVTLRDNVKWHDGTPLTVDDLLFTFKEVIQNPTLRNPILKSGFDGVGIKKTGDKTVSFTLPKPDSYFISNLTVGILPKHILKDAQIANLEKDAFGQNPIGSGPYKLNSLKLNNEGDVADLVSFADYYGDKPKIDRLRIFTFPNEEILMKQRSALDSISKLGFANAKIVEQDPKFARYNYTLNQFTALYFNTDNVFLKDKGVRQALSFALNKNELVMSDEMRVDALNLQDNSKDPAFAYDTAAATKLLDENGLTIGTTTPSQFRTNNKNEQASLLLLTSTKTPEKVSDGVKAAWEKIGIKVDVKRATPDEFYTLVNERRYSALLIKQNLGYNRDVYPIFHSSQIAGSAGNPSGLNFSNFRSFRTDGLTEAIRKENNPKDKEKLLLELSKVLADEIPLVFISTPVYSYFLDKTVEPFTVDGLDFHGNRFLILPYLQIKK